MTSGKQRKKELQAKRLEKQEKLQKITDAEHRAQGIDVDHSLLLPNNSYSISDFEQRGFYQDVPFTCKDCGKEEIWTGVQQKWWYEQMKGDVWTTAIRCRDCRIKKRERKAETKRVHMEGLAKKGKKKQ